MEANLQTGLAEFEPRLAEANLARIRGQWNEAVDTCVRVLRTHPGNADAHSLLGDIYRDQNAIDDAIQWYRMAVDLRPGGPDVAKLRKLEEERERRAARSGPLTASAAMGSYENVSGGTTQLMGYSPKRWLNTLTIVSACFLAATVIVLAILRPNPSLRGGPLPRPMQLSSHPMMPTAETGVKLPPVNPNRPAVLPAGEQPRGAVKIHQTGDGLEADRPDISRTAPLPTFSPQTPAGALVSPQSPGRNPELSPAPVQMVQPIHNSLTIAPVDDARSPQEREAAQSRARTVGAAGQGENRDGGREREPGTATGNEKPAPDSSAGESNSGGGTAVGER